MANQPYNPNLFLGDDGRLIDTSDYPGASLQQLGEEQDMRRRQAMYWKNWDNAFETNKARSVGPLKSPGEGFGLTGPLGKDQWSGFYGLMQGKENAAKMQGYGFQGAHPGTYKREALYQPTWNPLEGQSSAVGEFAKDADRESAYFRRRDSGPLAGLRRAGY